MTNREYPNSYDDVLSAILQAIADCSIRIESADSPSGQIVASAGISLRSWGERIEIQVSRADNRTKVSISSTPKAQLVDLGKSRGNIDRLFAAIDRHL